MPDTFCSDSTLRTRPPQAQDIASFQDLTFQRLLNKASAVDKSATCRPCVRDQYVTVAIHINVGMYIGSSVRVEPAIMRISSEVQRIRPT